jgi:hypothetical protein
MHYYKKLFLLLIFHVIALTPQLKAQSLSGGLSLTGKVADETGAPVASATVSILSVKDTAVIKGSLTDEKGSYTFNHLSPGDFFVSVSFVGFSTMRSTLIHLNELNGTVSLPVLTITHSETTLTGVTITAAKPLIEHQAGKTVVHIGSSILAIGNNALEILDRVPGVSLDQNNHVSLHGKQDVAIMINGKPTYLTADQLAGVLGGMDGARIESIEVMTTPPANYGAAGSAGLINIRLKNHHEQGLTGSLTAGAGYGRFLRDNTGFNFDYEHGKLNLYGSLARSDVKGLSTITIDRLVHQGALSAAYDQVTTTRVPAHNNNVQLGAEYDLSPASTIGAAFSGYLNSSRDDLYDLTTIGKLSAPIDSLLHSGSQSANTFHNYSINLNDRYKLDKKGQQLSLDLDYSRVNNNSDYRDTNRFYLPDGTLLHDPQVLTNRTPSLINIYVAKADYTNPLTKNLTFEAGVKFSKVTSDNNLMAQVLKDHTYINDTSRTNHFFYQERISAGYFNFKGTLHTLEFQAGLRAEFTRSAGDLVGGMLTKRSYMDFFPSLSLTQPLDPKNTVAFSYSRRVDRPAYSKLNPFKFPLDPYTADLGNAFLNPQYTNALELGFTHDQAFTLTLGYSHTAHAIMPIVFTEGNVSMQTDRNIDEVNSWNISADVPCQLAKWWNANISLNGFYNRFRSDTLAGRSINTGSPAFSVKAAQAFHLGSYSSELQVNYKSAHTSGILDFKSRYYADIALSRTFLEKRVALTLAVSDVFRTRYIRDESHLLNNDFTFAYRYDSRIVRLEFNYKFGSGKRKQLHRTGAENEKDRVTQGA